METSVEPTFDELKDFFNKSINIVFWKDAKIAYRFHKKTYGNIKFDKSTRHLKQRLFEVKDGETITSEYLKKINLKV